MCNCSYCPIPEKSGRYKVQFHSTKGEALIDVERKVWSAPHHPHYQDRLVDVPWGNYRSGDLIMQVGERLGDL